MESEMSSYPTYADQNARLDEILGRVHEVAVLPHVVYKVLELSGSDDTSAIEIERAIQIDPGFSSRVLTLANSAYFGLPKKVSSVKDAIMFCGLKSVRELAMTVGMYDMFMGKQDKQSLRRRGWWRHSLDTAVCGKWIAAATRAVAPEEAYTCGLLHLIGKPLLDRFGGEDYEQVERLVSEGYGEMDAENEVYGTNHVELSLAAAQRWGFPTTLCDGLCYLIPASEGDNVANRSHRAVVAVSSPIAWFAIQGKQAGNQTALALPMWATKILGIPDNGHLEVISGAIHAIGNAASIHG